MILFTHAAVGAAAAELTGSPGIALALGFASHFILDAIPHWDYELRSSRRDEQNHLNSDIVIGRAFAIDFIKMSLDTFFGIAAGLYFYGMILTPGDYLPVFFGICGGLLPDALQFAYFKIRREPLTSLQNFHHFIHTRYRLRGRYILGLVLQISLFSAIFLTIKLLT